MLTRELLRRLCRLTASRELDGAPIEVVAELLESANEALIETWLRMPAELRKLNVTQPMRAPTTVTVAPHTSGIGIGTALGDWVGCAIQMPDDPRPNRLISENALERPHEGNPANDGVQQSALVWHDAVHIPETATMFHEEVFVEQNGQHSTLVAWPHTIPLWSQFDVTPNMPCFYGVRGSGFTAPPPVDPLRGMPLIADPPAGWWLHLLPRPSAACTLRFTLNVQGERLSVADFRRNRRLLLPDRYAGHLMRIAEQKLMATRLFVGDPELAKRIDTEAERAREQIRNLITSHIEPRGTYGTPVGW